MKVRKKRQYTAFLKKQMVAGERRGVKIKKKKKKKKKKKLKLSEIKIFALRYIK